MRNQLKLYAAIVSLFLGIGCGGDDSGVPAFDAATTIPDAGAPGPDAAPPTPPPPLPAETREVTSGAGRVSGGGWVMDVRIGHGLELRN